MEAAMAANAAIPTHLHPVALRSTTNATSSRSAAASLLAEAQLRGYPENAPPQRTSSSKCTRSPPPTCSLPPVPATSPSSPKGAKSPVLSPRQSSLNRPEPSSMRQRKSPPIAGLQVDHSRYPFLTVRTTDADDENVEQRDDDDDEHDAGHRTSSPPPSDDRSTPSPPPQDRHTLVRLITAAQLAELVDEYHSSASIADDSLMFPWLHCSDQAGTAQANYFCSAHGAKAATVPRYRGLTLVTADADSPPCHRRRLRQVDSLRDRLIRSSQQLQQHRARTQSLGSSSTASSTSLESAVSSLFDGALSLASPGVPSPPSSSSTSSPDLIGTEPRPSLLTSTLTPDDFLARDGRTGTLLPCFSTPRLPQNVNLRLFKHQPARYATVSDIVVYSENGLCEDAVSLAETIQAAQDRVRRYRDQVAIEEGGHPNVVDYATYVVTDRFEEFERSHPHLVAVDGWGFRRNRIDFFEREREEMVALTKASEIATNVWLGNSNDVPLPACDEPGAAAFGARVAVGGGLATSDSSSSLATTLTTADDGNVHAFGVCVEAHDNAVMPSADVLLAHEDHFVAVEKELPDHPDASPTMMGGQDVYADLKPSIHYDEAAAGGAKVLRPHVADVAHLEVVSTAQICGSQAQAEELVERMVAMCEWVGKMAKPEDGEGKLAKRVLIHCHDGYTESSLFALSYTMWDRACSLPEAYLHLQLARQRSFFVYPADVALLGRIEARMQPLLTERRNRTEAAMADKMDIDSPSRSSSPLPPPPPPPAPSVTNPRAFLKHRYSFGLGGRHSSTPPAPSSSSTATTPTSTAERSRELHPWFYDDRFDGHFPSRILPFLYLGNLNHASNALMLRALGITHVVSMGESALVPPKSSSFPLSLSSQSLAATKTRSTASAANSLWQEHKAGRVQVLDMKNVADDGIDSIRPHIDRAVSFIEQARLSGGKVLVHCRVGVSRSATIVIAYVMKHLKLDLASAYLMVRSRRLNILIQPNLLFMWSLRKLEADLVEEESAKLVARRRATADGEGEEEWEAEMEEVRRRRGKMLSWSHFSREVAALNLRYLC